MNFPTLSVKPVSPVDCTCEDAVIRDQKDAGYVSTRPRFTRVREEYSLRFEEATQADVDSLKNFYHIQCANGSALFTWVHPSSGVSSDCRFKSPIKYSNTSYGRYSINIELEQV